MRVLSDFAKDYAVSDNYNSTFIYDYIISKSYEWKWTSKIINKCLKKIENLSGYTWITGKILEEYVWWNIRESLEKEGFKWRRGKDLLKTYYIKRNYQTKRQKKNGGIDLFVSIRDEYNNDYYCKIECSNWNNYKLNIEWLDKKIGYVHKRYSSSNMAIKCEVIPFFHYNRVQDYLDKHNIFPLLTDEQYNELDLLEKQLWENIS